MLNQLYSSIRLVSPLIRKWCIMCSCRALIVLIKQLYELGYTFLKYHDIHLDLCMCVRMLV